MRGGLFVARAVAAVCVGLVILGVPVLLLQAPAVTKALVTRYYDTSAGLPLPVALQAAEKVRVFVTDPSAPPLPATVAGRSGFDAAASSHLVDVRRVLAGARAATLAAAAVLALSLAFALPARRYRDVAFALRTGALGTLALAVVCAVAGARDFDAFFGFFHGLFFAAGTWTFPYGTLLIDLFAEPLWAALGALWAAGVAAGVACSLAIAAVLAKRGRGVVRQDV